MTKDLTTLSGNFFENCSEEDFDKLVENESVTFAERIIASQERIANANEHLRKAEEIKKKKLEFNKSIKMNDEQIQASKELAAAQTETLNLIQSTVSAICVSVKFSQKMEASIANMIETGFTARDGQFRTLDENSKKIAKKVITEAHRYAENAILAEKKEKELNDRLLYIESTIKTEVENSKQVIDLLKEEIKKIEEGLSKYVEEDAVENQIKKSLKNYVNNKDFESYQKDVEANTQNEIKKIEEKISNFVDADQITNVIKNYVEKDEIDGLQKNLQEKIDMLEEKLKHTEELVKNIENRIKVPSNQKILEIIGLILGSVGTILALLSIFVL